MLLYRIDCTLHLRKRYWLNASLVLKTRFGSSFFGAKNRFLLFFFLWFSRFHYNPICVRMCVRQNNNNETTTKMIYIWFRNYLLILDKYRRFLRGLCKLLFVLYRLSRIAWSSYHNMSEWKYKRNEGKIIIERKYINALENCMKRMSEAKKKQHNTTDSREQRITRELKSHPIVLLYLFLCDYFIYLH